MSILVDTNTRLVVQGLTGKEGTFHALACRDYGTRVVAGEGGIDLFFGESGFGTGFGGWAWGWVAMIGGFLG